eukprot:8223663-Pyramimonas_sp.AAC.1
MSEAVDPAAAAPAGYASDYSDALAAVTDVTYDADTPIDPRCIVTKRHGSFPPKNGRLPRWICRLGKDYD